MRYVSPFDLEKTSTAFTRRVGCSSSLVFYVLFFIISFSIIFAGISIDNVLLILTTVVSLEAIYLAIFIQMTINRNTAQLHEVGRDIEEMTEDIEDIQEDVEGISEGEAKEQAANAKIEKIEQALLTILNQMEGMKKNSRASGD